MRARIAVPSAKGVIRTHYLRAEMIYKIGGSTLVPVLNTDTYQRGEDGWRITHRLVKPLLPLVRTDP